MTVLSLLEHFYPGLHQPSDAHNFGRACISINRLRKRKKRIPRCKVIVDSGAFTEIANFGGYRHPVGAYAAELRRLYYGGVVIIAAAVAQDFMCEDHMLARTDATNTALGEHGGFGPLPAAALIAVHQRWTTERYDALMVALRAEFPEGVPFHVMPVLQGYRPEDYERHANDYGNRLRRGMWVGVGSVCKRNSAPEKIAEVLSPLAKFGFLIHGFGVKLTALLNAVVRELLYSADSMAWSFAARKQGRDPNDWREARAYEQRVRSILLRHAGGIFA